MIHLFYVLPFILIRLVMLLLALIAFIGDRKTFKAMGGFPLDWKEIKEHYEYFIS